MSQHVIELNGKRYDAISGKYLGKSSVIPQHILRGKVIDGFVRPTPIAKPAAPKPAQAEKKTEPKPAQKATAKPKPAPVHVHAAPKHLPAHRPEHAKTLKRQIVQKPEFTLKPAIKTQAPAAMTVKPSSVLVHKRSAASVDPARMERAVRTGQHQAIRHFAPGDGPAAVHTITPDVPVIAVQAAPITEVSHLTHVKKHHDIFEAAIAHATSHEQPAHIPKKHRTRRRMANAMAIVAAFLVIGGFVGYLNLPGIELRVASMQAGFSATMPTYTPTGYALQGGVKHTGGTVSLSFRSGDSSYTVTQQASNWNSQTLLDNTLALNGEHQTIHKNGQTIYIYGNGANAAWVNGGVRYDITGNAQLNSDDIAAIADSL